jgi:hypothetical protein
MSLHYFDQNSTWRAGRYRVQLFTRAAVAGTTRHRLFLVP